MCCKPGCLVWNLRNGSIGWWNYNAVNVGRRKLDTVFILNMCRCVARIWRSCMRLTFPRVRLTCDVIERTVCELQWVSILSGDGFGVRSWGVGVLGEGLVLK